MDKIVGISGHRTEGMWSVEVVFSDGMCLYGIGATFADALCSALGVHPDDTDLRAEVLT